LFQIVGIVFFAIYVSQGNVAAYEFESLVSLLVKKGKDVVCTSSVLFFSSLCVTFNMPRP